MNKNLIYSVSQSKEFCVTLITCTSTGQQDLRAVSVVPQLLRKSSSQYDFFPLQ